MRQAVVRDSDGFVTNVIEALENWDGVAEGHTLIPSDTAGPGDTWDGTDFIRPPRPAPDPDIEILMVLRQDLQDDKALTLAEIRKMLKLERQLEL